MEECSMCNKEEEEGKRKLGAGCDDERPGGVRREEGGAFGSYGGVCPKMRCGDVVEWAPRRRVHGCLLG
ncbi:hypothetical protein PIB30_096617 [Stylosanthes scabra]|uniref:Uncharacterized protein n=1 Tax=Stylosanthes scabra TaxID=79078 RepID=A0ABU6RWK9_9FABA|nr:hypothetical protein [Stylosanthes scabra]